jgi:raffinose/stachyose/melibiose transport system substrate-binding protein
VPGPTSKSTKASIQRSQGNSRPGQLLAFAIAMACIMIGTTTTTSAQPDALHSSAQPAGQSLTMWAPLPEFSTPGFDNLISRFDKLTGNKISVATIPLPFESSILAKFATGVRPDILIFDAIGNWIFALDPTRSLLPLDGMSFINKTIPQFIKVGDEFDGHVWAATLSFPMIDGMYYNNGDFARAGIPVPNNYAGVLNACSVLKSKDPGVAPIYVAAEGTDDWTDQIFPFMMWNNALKTNSSIIPNIDRNKGSFASRTFVSGFAELRALQNKGCLNSDPLSGTYVDQLKALETGQAAMIFQLSLVVPALVTDYGAAAVNKNVGFTCVSQLTGVCSWQSTASAENIFVPNTGNTAKEKVAKQFIQYATTVGYPTFVAESQTYPALQGYTKYVDTKAIPLPQREAYAMFLKDSIPGYAQGLLANYGPLQDNIQAMLDGKLTAQQVGSKMEQDFVTSAQEAGLPGF